MNDDRLASLKAFSFLSNEISIRGYMSLHDGTYNHLTYFKENKTMRREAQNIGLAFDLLTPKLSCLIRSSHLILETNVVERVNSGQISLVVTCTADCTCHPSFLRELINLKQIKPFSYPK